MASVGMTAVRPAVERIERYLFHEDGCILNSPLPALVYRDIFAMSDDLPERIEAQFARHGWTEGWRGGLFSDTRFHSSAHAALGVARGKLKLRLGGDHGASVDLNVGDVVILPAGLGHRCENASEGLLLVGASPRGCRRDFCKGEPAMRAEVCARIAAVPHPSQDPVAGATGPLMKIWV